MHPHRYAYVVLCALLAALRGYADVLSVAWSPDGGLLAWAGFDGKVRVWGLPGALESH
jgi:WD40 repeat protein